MGSFDEQAHEEQIGRILNEFLDRRSRGEAVSEQTLFRQHPEFADELQEHLVLLQKMSDSQDGRSSVSEKYPPLDLPGYRMVREIGRGGMGIVYEAWDTRLDCPRAVKTIVGRHPSEVQQSLFAREAKLAAQLRHPNIVTVHAYCDDTSPPCLIMDLVDGVSITAAARNSSFRRKAELIEIVARTIEYAHVKGLVHRDLKPSNILVDRDGDPRILDFGLARMVAVQADKPTLAGGVKGTPAYMAPEQFIQPDQVGPPADIFALGLILYELLTGSPPQGARNASSAVFSQVSELPLPRDQNPAIPEVLQRICLKACEPKIEDRYISAKDMADDLRRFLDGVPVRTRPRRYGRLLKDRIGAQLDELAHWKQDQLISARELDVLGHQYLALLRTESHWVPGARRIRPGPILVQLGGWLVVLSAIIWPAFYWNQLSAGQRILAIGGPTLMVNVMVWMLWARSSQLIALIFTVTGTLLSAAFWLVLFGELHVFELRGADAYELFPPDYFCNRQLLTAMLLAALYAILWSTRKPFALLSADTCLLLGLAYASFLLLFGMKEWVLQEEYAKLASSWLPYIVIMYFIGRQLDSPEHDHLAGPFYGVAGLGFVLVTGGMALDAPAHWLHLKSRENPNTPDWLMVTRCAFFFLSGLIFLGLAVVHDRAATRLRRMWGRLYFKLVPPFCLLSLDRMGDEPFWILGRMGYADMTLVAAAVPVICLMIIACGVKLQLRWYVYYGLLHTSWFIFRATMRYFKQQLSWPIGLVTIGTVAMILGMIYEIWIHHQQGECR